MSDVLDKPIVLLLNRAWQPIGHRTVKQALVAMCGGSDGIAPAVALDIRYGTLPDGIWDFTQPQYLNPVKWDQWLQLPIRDFDHVIPRSRGGKDSFDNLVWAKKSVNSAKSDRLPHEAGLRLHRVPK